MRYSVKVRDEATIIYPFIASLDATDARLLVFVDAYDEVHGLMAYSFIVGKCIPNCGFQSDYYRDQR